MWLAKNDFGSVLQKTAVFKTAVFGPVLQINHGFGFSVWFFALCVL